MDNIFLVWDIYDLFTLCDMDVGVISLDQEKAYDRVDHNHLFTTLRAFGFGNSLSCLVQAAVQRCICLVKIGAGLSSLVEVQRGIRQGCSLSGLLYTLTIELFLHRLCFKLSGFALPSLAHRCAIVASAYADDVTVFVSSQRDVAPVCDCLGLLQKASSAKVNWDKCTARRINRWVDRLPLLLPGNLSW